MSEKRTAILLVLAIIFFSGVGIFFLDYVGVIQSSDVLPFLEEDNPVKVEDPDFPTEVEKLKYSKWEQQLIEKEEKLAKSEAALKTREEELERKEKDIEEMRESLKQQKKKLYVMTKDFEDRQKKIADLASKVTNMPPEKAREMMQNWKDFDIIDVLRQIDRDAEREGGQSISPYLLTLFSPERRAEITRKMLLPPLEHQTTVEN